MRITSIGIQNFRGIKFAELSNLGSMVVIAGTNGSGKSTIFDAIRLLKSVYGSPNRNEPDQWFGEFQMPLDNTPDAFIPLFNDKTKSLEIVATFELDETERAYVNTHARELISSVVSKDVTGEGGKWRAQIMAALDRTIRQSNAEIAKYVDSLVEEMKVELAQDIFTAKFSIKPGEIPEIPPSRTLETLFSTSDPLHLGGLRYHSAQRNYAREQLQNVAINVVEQRRSDPSSYLYGNAQYTNIKQEMATAYVKELVAKDAGVELEEQSSIESTLRELFTRFFPGKEFLGARPNREGNVFFPVQIGENSRHDLDDLSSGEKEIVYGYLRMRNTSPRHSVVLIDEPELHLNPLLIGGLPEFYHRHLGAGLNNQLWLVTHSDTLLRASMGRSEYSIYHMVPQTSAQDGVSQAVPLEINEGATRAFHDLVGDWAAFRPGAKLVIFEGGGSTDFDVHVTGTLFPQERERMNFLSAGSRSHGRAMHQAVQLTDLASDIKRKVFSVTDADADADESVDNVNRFSWDRYHIENYLLDFDCIAAVVGKLLGQKLEVSQIERDFRGAAKATSGPLIRHELAKFARRAFGDVLDVSVDPRLESLSGAIGRRVADIPAKIERIAAEKLTQEALANVEAEARSKYSADIESGKWISSFKGRDVIKKYLDTRLPDIVQYNAFINLILDEMLLRGVRPPGMALVIQAIDAA